MHERPTTTVAAHMAMTIKFVRLFRPVQHPTSHESPHMNEAQVEKLQQMFGNSTVFVPEGACAGRWALRVRGWSTSTRFVREVTIRPSWDAQEFDRCAETRQAPGYTAKKAMG